ncbi:MAG TPA: hypothetical protein DCP90_02730 [Clostridiales bacterium]|nr:MAG: hypothetical protein A2Y22_01520 [Clostridiales bacterium GWD2_32_59]HAN09508.1 hypothetical protein [Clostridiales bacterium]
MFVAGLSGITQISAGCYGAIALESNGKVWAWGWNAFGEVGDNTTIQRKTPVQVHGVNNVGDLSNISHIASGEAFFLALNATSGTVYAWGRNVVGQLGDNSTVNRWTPVQVSGLSGITQLSAGNNFSIALKNDGTVYTWGDNSSGQLGDNTIINRWTPVQVSGLSEITQVSGGNVFSIVLKNNGTVWTWGYNGVGSLGDNTIIQRKTPVQVHGVNDFEYLEGITSISIGSTSGGQLSAIKSDGTVYAWGSNGAGQLGDNTIIERHTPVQVLGVGGAGIFSVDTTPPDVEISASPISPTNATTVTYTFEFSKNVTGFTVDDINVTNGTRKDGTFDEVDGDTYTIEVDKLADGEQIVAVAAEACQDVAGNLNTEGTITVVMTNIVTSPGYSEGTVAGDRKWFKYYLGMDAVSGVIKAMLVAPKDGIGVRQGTFIRADILDPDTHKFISGQIYYINREGKIELYN